MAQQITTFIENKPGTLAEFCRILKMHDIDMRAMNVSDAMDFGIVRVVVSDTDETIRVLRDSGYVCQREDVLAIEVEDQPGALVGLYTALGEAGVNLDYTYALFSGKENKAAFVIKTTDRTHAMETLEKLGVKLLSDDEL